MKSHNAMCSLILFFECEVGKWATNIWCAASPKILTSLHFYTFVIRLWFSVLVTMVYISCKQVIVNLIVWTLKRVLLRMQYVMEYLHMILLTKQHFATIQSHSVLDNHPHPLYILNSQYSVSLTLSFFLFVFYLQYQVPREFSLTVTLTIQPCVLYAIFLPAGNCF